jgi:hypothetical protein
LKLDQARRLMELEKENARLKRVVADTGINFLHRQSIAEFAARNRLPAIYGWRESVEAEGLRVRTAPGTGRPPKPLPGSGGGSC